MMLLSPCPCFSYTKNKIIQKLVKKESPKETAASQQGHIVQEEKRCQ